MTAKKSANTKPKQKRTSTTKKKPALHTITGKIRFKNPKSGLKTPRGVKGPFRLVNSQLLLLHPDNKTKPVPLNFELYEFTSIIDSSLSRFLPPGQVAQVAKGIKATCLRITEQPKHDAHKKGLAQKAIQLCDELEHRLKGNDATGAASTALRLGTTFQWMLVCDAVPAAMTGHPVRAGVSKGGRGKGKKFAHLYPQFQAAINEVTASNPGISHDKASRLVAVGERFKNPSTGKPVSYKTIKRHTSLPKKS